MGVLVWSKFSVGSGPCLNELKISPVIRSFSCLSTLSGVIRVFLLCCCVCMGHLMLVILAPNFCRSPRIWLVIKGNVHLCGCCINIRGDSGPSGCVIVVVIDIICHCCIG